MVFFNEFFTFFRSLASTRSLSCVWDALAQYYFMTTFRIIFMIIFYDYFYDNFCDTFYDIFYDNVWDYSETETVSHG